MKSILKWIKSVKEKSFKILELVTRPENDLNFEVIKDLDGAVDGLTNNAADYFMWEKFTTKPLVDDGTFRRIDNCTSPWPCFVIAVRTEFLEQNKDELTTWCEENLPKDFFKDSILDTTEPKDMDAPRTQCKPLLSTSELRALKANRMLDILSVPEEQRNKTIKNKK